MQTIDKKQMYCGVCRNKIVGDSLVCRECDFWLEQWRDGNSGVARIKGAHYRIGVEHSNFKAQGGRKFTIEFFDGREVVTTNLWHQGQIPPRFRNLLPNNATFIGENNG